MTETSILPITSGDSVPPSSYDPGHDDGDSSGNRRKLLIVGGVVGAAIVLVAAFLLLHGGSSTSGAAATVPHGTFTGAASPAASGSGTGTTTGTTTLPKKGKAAVGRNPFTPLYVAPTAAAVTGGTAVGGTTTAAPTPAASGSAPATNPTPTPTQTSPSSGLGTPTYLQLISVDGTKSATFKVGYAHHKFKKYVVEAPSASSTTGTVFDTEFALIGIQGSVTTVQVGDATPITLAMGLVSPV
jgi:hypothetical protein